MEVLEYRTSTETVFTNDVLSGLQRSKAKSDVQEKGEKQNDYAYSSTASARLTICYTWYLVYG